MNIKTLNKRRAVVLSGTLALVFGGLVACSDNVSGTTTLDTDEYNAVGEYLPVSSSSTAVDSESGDVKEDGKDDGKGESPSSSTSGTSSDSKTDSASSAASGDSSDSKTDSASSAASGDSSDSKTDSASSAASGDSSDSKSDTPASSSSSASAFDNYDESQDDGSMDNEDYGDEVGLLPGTIQPSRADSTYVGQSEASIGTDYMQKVDESVAKDLDDLKDALEKGETPAGFEKSEVMDIIYAEIDSDHYTYYCFTDENEWLLIDFSNLKATGLPFLWNGHADGLKRKYTLRFEEACAAVYAKRN